MSSPLQQTFATLARSRNDAATAVLLTALDSTDTRVRDGALLGLVRRRSKAGHMAVLRRWHLLSPELKQSVDQSEGRMGGALHDALLGADERLFANACDVAHESGEFDLAPTLILVAERAEGMRGERATQLIVEMVDKLMNATSEEDPGGYSRHPETIRAGVLESLERSVERFAVHGRRDLVEAFVVLGGPGSASLRVILELPQHVCHQTVVDMLQVSARREVLELLVAYLRNYDAPLALRNTIARRTDAAFVGTLLTTPETGDGDWLAKNLSRMKSLACLESPESLCKRQSPAQQAVAMRLVARLGASDEVKLDFAAALLARGGPAARLAACEALAPIAGQRSNELVLAALDDGDADVQAAATRQLRGRHIPGTMAKLIELVASPHEAVRTAARESLSEFTFENFISRYETLDNEGRRTTGTLVAMIDVNALVQLRQELTSLVRRRRLRAIGAAEMMGVTAQIADALVERLDDEDHMVRAAAASALSNCTSTDVRDALISALGDRSFSVQSAARDSLRMLGVDAAADEAQTRESVQ